MYEVIMITTIVFWVTIYIILKNKTNETGNT